MSKLIKLLVLSCCFGAASFSQAADWRIVTTTTNNSSIFFVDYSSITKKLSSRKAWFYSINKVKTAYGEKSKKLLLEFDCLSKNYATLSATSYTDEDTVIDTYKPPSKAWKEIPPDSAGDLMLSFVCKEQSNKPSKDTIKDPRAFAAFFWTELDRDEMGPPPE